MVGGRRGRPIGFALLAGAGLLAFYLGVLTLAQGWAHAMQQLRVDRWYIASIVAGFATQVGLFTHLHGMRARLTAGGVAAGGGTSAAAMVACCAHHLADTLPILGLSGAAVFLVGFRIPLLWLGILLNLAGTAYLLYRLHRFYRSSSRQGRRCDEGEAASSPKADATPSPKADVTSPPERIRGPHQAEWPRR